MLIVYICMRHSTRYSFSQRFFSLSVIDWWNKLKMRSFNIIHRCQGSKRNMHLTLWMMRKKQTLNQKNQPNKQRSWFIARIVTLTIGDSEVQGVKLQLKLGFNVKNYLNQEIKQTTVLTKRESWFRSKYGKRIEIGISPELPSSFAGSSVSPLPTP